MVGIGIRLAQDVGAHRKKVYNTPHSVETELWKRAFWYVLKITSRNPLLIAFVIGCLWGWTDLAAQH